ncbi:MAG: CRISPR-associated endoribonuclease Cas6, partial [Deltaproteobacteria bacterium]|nr:CRISPR-associated endoribonuclease Cas6 [Deltaproteobacteria bacterium]
PLFTGYISRGLLLAMLRRVDPVLAQRLHEPQSPKPYSVTPLRFKSRARTRDGYVLDPAYPCRVKFRFLAEGYARRLIDYFTERGEVLIYDAAFRVASISLRFVDYSELEEAEALDSLSLVFRSPTYLSSIGSRYNVLFPDPVQVFSNLMRLWDAHSTSKKYGREGFVAYKEWLGRHVGVTKHRLSTALADMKRKKAVGFKGWVTYEMDSLDEWNQTTVSLAKFAEYSNIGGNRTGGFGEVKLSNLVVNKTSSTP